ncbi:MAG TPA: glycosyltransferase family 4 protein [Hymenobacter sp.]|jgi:glycosyltransferase involved in cell wall biosynthesis
MPLKILLLSHRFHPDIGGIEVNSEIYAHAFTAAGHEVRVVTWSASLEEDAFPFVVVRNPSKRTLFREHAWADVIFENNPCIRLGWPGLFFGRPRVISLNTEYHNNAAGLVKRAWLKRAAAVISVSEAVRRKCWPGASVISNPYRSKEFRVLPEVRRTDDFVFLGRLVSQKGADQAVLAFHRVLRLLDEEDHLADGPCLTIVGDGPERPKLVGLVERLGLTGRVHFVGFLHGEKLVRQLNAHRYLLVPSIYGEAFGNVVLEGMACGCVPIVSDSDGLPDAAGRAGLVFSRGSVESLAAGIWRILHDPMLELQLRQAAPAHLANHEPEVIACRYLQVLENAAGYPSEGGTPCPPVAHNVHSASSGG